MTAEEAFEWVNSLSSRKKKLDHYKDWIVAWLQEYPHLSAAQIQDWLLERFPDLDVGESTIRLYVNKIREEYQIAKTKKIGNMSQLKNNLWANRCKSIGEKRSKKPKIKKK